MNMVLLGICLFILLFNVLVSAVRGARKSVLRLLTVIFSAVAAFFLSRALCVKMAAWLLPQLQELFAGNETLAPFVNGEIAAGDAVTLLAEMLVAPLLFLLLYVIIKLLTLIVFAILKLLTGFLKPLDKNGFSRLIGAAVGVVIGLIGVVVFVTPVLGYADLVSATVEVAVQSSATADTVENTMGEEGTKRLIDAEALGTLNSDYLKPLLETPVVSNLYRSVGSRIFDSLASEEWDGEQVNLKKELSALADIVANIGVLGDGGITAFSESESAAVERIAQDVSASPLLSDLFAGTVSVASKHWLAGETFLGMERPDMGVNANPLFDAFLQVFATADRATVREDLDFFSDTFGLFVEHELFAVFVAEEANDDAISMLVSDSGLYADVQVLIDEHPRMQPVGKALVDFGMRVMLEELGLPADLRESCEELLVDMTDVLQNVPANEDGTLNAEVLTQDLSQVFADNGLDVSDEATHLIAEGVADHFTAEELRELDADEVIDKLIERFDSVDISGLLASIPPLS